MRVFLLCVSLLLAAAYAEAAERRNPFQCKRDGNQQELNACAANDYEAADKALGRKYKEILASLPPAKQKDLRQQQRAWVKQRDPHCKAETKSYQGGSIWPLEFLGCLKSSTERRTQELGDWRP
jgi:uncharacterized protein YecT (DUF1311 family)